MSHNVHTEIKKNVAHLYENEVLTEAAVLRAEAEDEGQLLDFEVAGWKGPEHDDGDLIGYALTKNASTVYLINSSQYSHVGEYEWTVYGTKPAVRNFLKDITDDEVEIKDQDVVQSWS